MNQEHTDFDTDFDNDNHSESNAALAFLWVADTLGACVLIAFIVAAFFVLGVLTDKTDSGRHGLHPHLTTTQEAQ